MSNGFIYKISSPDNKLHYYGLTTTSVQKRYDSHIQSYYSYKNHTSTNYCTSYIIFEQYPVTDIQLNTIESHEHITIQELRDKEKYYIRNFDCVNMYGKQNPTSYTNFIDVKDNIYTPIYNFTLQSYDTNITYILRTLGYFIHTNPDNTLTLTHRTFISLKNIYQNLKHILQTHHHGNAHIIYQLNNILTQYNLTLIYKQSFSKYYKKPIIYYKILVIPNNITPSIPPTPTKPTTQNITIDLSDIIFEPFDINNYI
jgi:hypothetical protein